MKKIILFSVLALALIVVLIWFGKKNNKSGIKYDTDTPFTTSIVKKSVATGKVIPLEEIEIKPRISGILEKIYVEEGETVKKGDLIAKIRVVPNVQSLNNAQSSVTNAKLQFDNAKVLYNRNKMLYEKGVIAQQEFENVQLNFNTAEEQYNTALRQLQIVKKGTASGLGNVANTNVRAEITGTILEIPVREGMSVIESNTFSPGTTIATVADMNKMIFEGKVDEAEVGKLQTGTEIEIDLGAYQETKFPAVLTFVAPKGTEESGAVQFKIKADVDTSGDYKIRANYSANANIVLEKKDSIMAIKESLIRYNIEDDTPYVEIQNGDNKFEKTNIKLGISDGINVEIVEGLTMDDKIKVWNKTSKDDDDKKDE